MKAFIKHIIFLTTLLLAFLFVLDMAYTNVFGRVEPRNKTQYILSLSETDSIDYVFFGSSRVENTIVTSKISDITGKKAINIGTQGSRLSDINLFLNLMIANGVKMKRVFIQVDYIYNLNTNSDLVKSQAMPFIRNHSAINDYFKLKDSNYIKNYYIPFYRYLTNDYRIGFREFIASAVNKPSNTNFEDGFKPLYGTMGKNNYVSLPLEIATTNKSIISIDSICKKNNIEVTYFCAPFCSHLKNGDYIEKLEQKIANFKNFSKAISDDELFKNCSHLNYKGANIFTELLIKELSL